MVAGRTAHRVLRGAESSAGYGVTEIWVARADGAGQHMVARAGPDSSASLPAWSPDGREVAYHVQVAPGAVVRPGIYLIRRDGTHKRRLHDGRAPSWSAGGDLIAFRRVRQPRNLAVIGPDGSASWGSGGSPIQG